MRHRSLKSVSPGFCWVERPLPPSERAPSLGIEGACFPIGELLQQQRFQEPGAERRLRGFTTGSLLGYCSMVDFHLRALKSLVLLNSDTFCRSGKVVRCLPATVPVDVVFASNNSTERVFGPRLSKSWPFTVRSLS